MKQGLLFTIIAIMESSLDSTNQQIVSVVNQFFQFGFYTGEWSTETKKPHGQGRWFKVDVLRYEGGWNQGDWDGLGTVYGEDGVRICTGRYKKDSFTDLRPYLVKMELQWKQNLIMYLEKRDLI